MAGRADNNRVVYFAGDPGMTARFVDVRITASLTQMLHGELVSNQI